MKVIKRLFGRRHSRAPLPLPDRWDVLTLRGLNLRIDLPEHWVTDPSNLLLLSYDPQGGPPDARGQVAAGVMVQHTDWLSKESLRLTPHDALAKMFRSPETLQRRERKVLSVTPFDLHGATAADLVMFESTKSSSTRQLRDLELFVEGSPSGEDAFRLISVCCAAMSSSFESYDAIFATILQSVSIE